ncbi:hypothetical protein [Desulfovibrio sp.]|uniref:hypothetical protein n=1 Tax=Desulfovibrio sp. TaxID=885 RepID=UPI0025C374D6|nr:hypothetical protein [Desulfovibrio sp.]
MRLVLPLRQIYRRATFACAIARLPGLCLTGALAYVVAGGLVCSSAQGASLLEREVT